MTLTDADRAAIMAELAKWDASNMIDMDADLYRAGIRAGLERAAKVCEDEHTLWHQYMMSASTSWEASEHRMRKVGAWGCAAAIRAIISETGESPLR